MIEACVPRELARSVLPLATYSHMFGTVNLHNLFRFIAERSHGHAQYEIRVYSNVLLKMAMSVAPVATQAFIDKIGYSFDE
jgi:thymidylate synthase (FAD)